MPVQDCVEGFVFVRGPVKVLMLKRSAARGGWWQSVSGRVEPSDASYDAAVRREVREETGFSDVARTIPFDWNLVFRGKDRPWRTHAFGVEVPRELPPHLSEEHTEHRWCSLAEALSLLHWPDNREALRRLAQREGLF